MIDRRDVLISSATALAATLVADPRPAAAQSVTAPKTQSGFLDRPGCRIYYEVTGTGAPIIFIHGIGSNHLTWFQQVPHFGNRYSCVTYSHRGYPPSSEIGVPDPKEFAGDLAALIEHLKLHNPCLIAQSMGGWSAIEYVLGKPENKPRALVLVSTCGTIHRASVPLRDTGQLAAWIKSSAAARADMAQRGISPPAGERMAREQPALHFLYRSIANASAAFDREQLRPRTAAMATRSPELLRDITIPTLFVIGDEDTSYPAFVSQALAEIMPNARVEQVANTGHSVAYQRADAFNRIVDSFLSKAG
jgi:pimeloyl-ACP methyl ester carboxylesterase